MNFHMIQKDTLWDAHYCVHYYTKFGITSLSVIYVARRCICCLRNRARRESLQSKLFVSIIGLGVKSTVKKILRAICTNNYIFGEVYEYKFF